MAFVTFMPSHIIAHLAAIRRAGHLGLLAVSFIQNAECSVCQGHSSKAEGFQFQQVVTGAIQKEGKRTFFPLFPLFLLKLLRSLV